MSATPSRRLRRRLFAPLDRRALVRRIAAYHAAPRDVERAVDAAIDLGGRGAYRVKSVQRRSEILALARAVDALAPRVIVEIGTHRGGTLFLWSQLATAHVITCDVEAPGPRGALYGSFPPPGRGVRVDALTGDSHDPAFRARVVACLGGRPIDFLFIDGDHTEAGVEADYRDYAPLVRPGGLVALHDIAPRQAIETNRVDAFWRRLAPTVDAQAIVEDSDQVGFGIGLVRVASDPLEPPSRGG